MTLLFPFQPDWSSSYKVVRTYKTDIITSRSGKEQRRACRNRPRRSLEFTVTELNEQTNLLARTMNRQQGADIYMADYSRQAVTTSNLAAGDATVDFASVPSWMAGPVVLVNGPAMEVRQPGTQSSGAVTFADTTANAWAAGTFVYPALLGRLAAELQGTRITDQKVQVTVDFDVRPASEPEIDPPAAPVTFNDREVFLIRPDWGQAFGLNFQHPFETVDYGEGRVAYINPIAFASLAQQTTWLELTPADMTLVEDVFTRAKGQRGEFYMPTWVNDLPPLTVAHSGTNTFTVAGNDVANDYSGDTVFKALCVVYLDGTFQFAKISGISASGGNSVVECATNFTRDIDPATVSMVCWMPVWRFASDGMTTEWISNFVAQSQLNVVSLEDLTPES